MSDLKKNRDSHFEKSLLLFSGHFKMVEIYPRNHSALKNNLEELEKSLNNLIGEEGMVSFSVIQGEIIFENRPHLNLSQKLPALIRFFQEEGFSRMTFLKGLKLEELENFFWVMTRGKKEKPPNLSWKNHLKKTGIDHILCDFLTLKDGGAGDFEEESFSQTGEKLEVSLDEIFEGAVEAIKGLQKMVESGKNLDFDYLSHLISHITPQVLHHYKDLFLLGNLKTHHEYTFEHDLNVAVLSCYLGASMGLPSDILEGLCMAAFFHDLGKQNISLEILNKKGRLDEKETLQMQKHCQEGSKKIFLEGMGEIPAIVAFEHHLNFDGTGYPCLARQRPLSLVSQIVSIADVYDALRSTRVYKEETSPEEVHLIIQEMKGTRFDPDLVDFFFRVVGVFPPGISVKLDSGEKASVVQTNPADIFRPLIRILTDREGVVLEKPFLVSLSEKKEGRYSRSIVRSISRT